MLFHLVRLPFLAGDERSRGITLSRMQLARGKTRCEATVDGVCVYVEAVLAAGLNGDGHRVVSVTLRDARDDRR